MFFDQTRPDRRTGLGLGVSLSGKRNDAFPYGPAHEICRKKEAGLSGECRGQEAAALDAAGGALCAVGLLAFAIVFSLIVEQGIAAPSRVPLRSGLLF